MKPETRIAILEAFASTKPVEFDAFTLDWLRANPQPVDVEAVVEEAALKPKRGRKRKEHDLEAEESLEEISSV